MSLEGARDAADVVPSFGRWAWAIVTTAFVAPWLSLGGILIVFGALFVSDLAPYILSYGLFMMYGFGFIPSLLSVCGFSVVYARFRNKKKRHILRRYGALFGFVLSFVLVSAIEAITGKEIDEIFGLALFFAVNGAMAGYFGSAIFMNIVDGRLVPVGPEPPANWHR